MASADRRGAPRAPGSLRVIGGALRGRRLRAPAGRTTRPTADRVREAVFDLLGPVPPRGRALDLFAGSGALGIEALSRGAASATFVERDAVARRSLRENLAALGLDDRAVVLGADVLGRRPWPGAPFDLVLADPPYGTVDLAALGRRVAAVLAPGGVLVLERPAGEPPPPLSGLAPWKDRRYGGTSVTLYRAPDAEEEPA